jgi:tetratricopeptide (TPR) repeat protein
MSAGASQSQAASGRGSVLLPVLLLGLLVVGIYGRVVGHEFVSLDDPSYILDNPHVVRGLSWDGVRWAFTTFHASNWHPLTWLSHMVDVELFGLEPGGHHAVSVLLHALNAALLFMALRGMTAEPWPSFLAAALFAVHPLCVESVAWAAERKDALSGTFWMLVLVAYGGYARGPRPSRFALVFGLLALGLMAKPMLVTLPLVLLLLDAWPLGRWRPGLRSAGGLLLEKLPLLGLSAASSVVTVLAQRGALAPIQELVLGTRLANALVAYVAYAWNALWPAGLACFYPHAAIVAPERSSRWIAEGVGAGVLLVIVTLAVVRARTRRPYLAVGWLWYVGTLVPVIGVFQVGSQSMADRYTYLPSVGLGLMLAWGVKELAAGLPRARWVPGAAATAGVAALAVWAWIQVGHWRDSRALFEHAIRVTSRNYFAHASLAATLLEAGEIDLARSHYERALGIVPNYARARRGLGDVFERQGEVAPAAAEYERALRDNPRDVETLNSLGVMLKRQGNLAGAAARYEEALRIRPEFARAHYNLANVHELRGDLGRAALHYERAIALDPRHARAHYGLGLILERQGDLRGAARHYAEALRVDPGYGSAREALARIGAAGSEAAAGR